jgi:hypothetical protein
MYMNMSSSPQAQVQQERIAAAAIRHPDGEVFSVPPPGRHNHVIFLMIESGRYPVDANGERRMSQGFVTNTGRFVDRVEARGIAEEAGQLIDRAQTSSRLFSEDMW